MPTECSPDSLDFGTVEGRKVVADFGGGEITSNAGGLLLGAADKAVRLIERFAACFRDGRKQSAIEHSLATLVGQRVFAIALGHEDLLDHDELRHDPVLALLAGKLKARRKDCAPVAGKSTLNRLEHAPEEGPVDAPARYHKISHDAAAIDDLLVAIFLEGHTTPPEEIILDVDATDDPLHGHQEGRFFHGFYDCYCYLPLYIFCGRDLLCARLRRANIDASAGAVDEIRRIVARIRKCWPKVRIILRADSGFARETLMAWCEANGVDYVFGLARNPRLQAAIAPELEAVVDVAREAGLPSLRHYSDFHWSTIDSWSCRRRVVAKAEAVKGEPNPRFVVTSIEQNEIDAATLYERLYCQRGEMENRIKECQLDLYADRTSASTMRANQLRLWFASFAYVLMCTVRRIGLAGTKLATATCGTIRLKLLKVGAQVTRSVRRIRVAMTSSCPQAGIFIAAHRRLRAAAA